MTLRRILICPDKFKDALSARAAAQAIADGVRDALPDAAIALRPMADGGEGSGRLLAEATGVREHSRTVLDPLARPREAHWWLEDGGNAIVEMAEASGLALLAPCERNPLHTTSFGTGQLIRTACKNGAQRVTICVGGSATVDGGAGCLQALGFLFTNAAGVEFRAPLRGSDLPDIAHFRAPPQSSCTFRVLTDVSNPLIGPNGAARIFGPQKGADASAVAALEAGLEHWADVLHEQTGVDVRDLRGGGAAGGIAAGLYAAVGAELVPGAPAIADSIGLIPELGHCDLCITGEGRVDAQTSAGKTVSIVAQLAAAAGIPVLVLAGNADNDILISGAEIMQITPPGTPLETALPATAENLRCAVREWLRNHAPKH